MRTLVIFVAGALVGAVVCIGYAVAGIASGARTSGDP